MTIELHNLIQANGNQITGLGTPTQNTHAATKQYVDSVAQGLDIKASVKAATVPGGNLTLSGTQTVDGVELAADDRILVKNQTTQSENGIYEVKAGSWTRATDATGSNLTLGAFTFVEGGTANKGRGYVYSDTNTWTQFSESTVLTAGTGITVNGQTISIDTAWTGQTAITTLGTISTGTWQGGTIGVAYGGTGATTLTGYVKGDGTNPLTASTTIPVTDITGRKLIGSLTFEHSTGAAVVKNIDTTSLDSTLRANAVVQLRDSAGNAVLAGVKNEANQIAITVTNNGLSDITLSYVVLI
jgi:hypothetical protein